MISFPSQVRINCQVTSKNLIRAKTKAKSTPLERAETLTTEFTTRSASRMTGLCLDLATMTRKHRQSNKIDKNRLRCWAGFHESLTSPSRCIIQDLARIKRKTTYQRTVATCKLKTGQVACLNLSFQWRRKTRKESFRKLSGSMHPDPALTHLAREASPIDTKTRTITSCTSLIARSNCMIRRSWTCRGLSTTSCHQTLATLTSRRRPALRFLNITTVFLRRK